MHRRRANRDTTPVFGASWRGYNSGYCGDHLAWKVLPRRTTPYTPTQRGDFLMATTPDDVLKLIKDKEVKFVDLRFTDTRGKEQHVTVPVKYFGKDKFETGHAFDGSSIAGWKGIQASDMLLMPDASSARMDPFTDEPVLNLTCDVYEPMDGKPYDRDPRSIAKRAETYLKSTGLGDVSYFGPEPEFFIFDRVTQPVHMSACLVKIKSGEAPSLSAID